MKKKLEAIIGFPLKNITLFEEAFTHKSFANEQRGYNNNERLEFLGDAVLELVTTEFLFSIFPDAAEGELTKLRSALVSGASLAELAKALKLGSFLRLSRGEMASGGQKKNPLLANVVEALIGAIYLDAGLETVRAFLQQQLFPKLPKILENNLHQDPKSHFQEWAQEVKNITPHYEVLATEGPDHEKVFVVSVSLESEKYADGRGSSKQKAEIDAAKNALKNIDHLIL